MVFDVSTLFASYVDGEKKMKIRLEIKTPDGMAMGVVKGDNMRLKLLRRMLGINLRHDDIKVNDANNLITWRVESEPRNCMKVIRNVQMYDTIVSGVFSSKILKKAIKKHMDDEQQKELKSMLTDMTKITVVRE